MKNEKITFKKTIRYHINIPHVKYRLSFLKL